jgi:hypothetical protein
MLWTIYLVLIQQKGKIMAKIFLSFSVLICFVGCEQLENISELDTSYNYPTQVGQEWEYNTMWKSEFYDQSGNIDSASFLNMGNTIVRITKENERVGNYNNLILFEAYEINTPQNIHRIWYSNSDTGFFAIAYSNPGAVQPVLPKLTNSSFEYFKALVNGNSMLPGYLFVTNPNTMLADSIQFYSSSRKVFAYPFQTGSRWVELIEPFYRERFINKVEQINVSAGNYLCYKVESEMFFQNLILNDYVSSSSGLIMREIIADSMLLVTVTNPDSGAFIKSTTISKLVRETKP